MLDIYFHRKYSGLIAAVSSVLAVAGGVGLAGARSTFPVPVQFLGWLIILALVWGIIAGLRQLWRPPLMYSADTRGVTIYYDAKRVRFGAKGVFLPWGIVSGMAIEKRTGIGATRNRAHTWVVACALNEKPPFPVQKHSVAYSPQDAEQVVCLDAFTGSVSGKEMLNELISLWKAAQSLAKDKMAAKGLQERGSA